MSGGYPGEYSKGKRIELGETSTGKRRHTKTVFCSCVCIDVVVFHCGTSRNGNELLTAGGRVLAVSAVAPSLEEALSSVYTAVDKISFEGKVYRRDIAHRQGNITSRIVNAHFCTRALTSANSVGKGLTYEQAGVSVDAGNALVDAIKPYVRATKRTGSDGEIGGFGGVFDLKAVGYKDPLLVSGTDGVGTKLRIAIETGIHESVGEF